MAGRKQVTGGDLNGDPSGEAGPSLVHDAGLVLVSAWLPRLWEQWPLDPDARPGDRHLSAQILTAISGAFDLPNARPGIACLLSGYDAAPDTIGPLDPHVSPRVRELTEQLLRAMMQAWPALSGTTPDGLRQSFLRRDGVLEYGAAGWHLSVPPQAFDMLLQSFPVNFGLIQTGPMDVPLRVDWGHH